MKLLEYQAAEIFAEYGISVANGVVIDNLEKIEEKIRPLSFPLVVKSQVQVGGRGKAGGIKFAEDISELKDVCGKLLHSDLKGHKVNKLLIVEKVKGTKELYLSIILDRLHKTPLVIFSSEGGMDIEEIAKTKPEAIVKIPIDPEIGVRKYIAQYIVNKSGISKDLTNNLDDTISRLYKTFIQTDALLVEINPLLVGKGNKLIALDGKVDIDDSALYRQQRIVEYRDSIQEDALVLEARKYGLLYIPIVKGGTTAIISNGSGMIMSCIDLIKKAGFEVGSALDLGGGSTADRINKAVRIVLSNPDIKYLFINIFGGITRCDEVANGVKVAVEAQPKGKYVIIRLEGTNKELGLEIINSINYDVVSVDNIKDGVVEIGKRGKCS